MKKTEGTLTGLELFFDVRAPFLITGVIFVNFRQLGNLPFSSDLLKQKQIAAVKKFSFALIALTVMSLTWMPFEPSSTFISVSKSCLETRLKEKFALFWYSDVIARTLG